MQSVSCLNVDQQTEGELSELRYDKEFHAFSVQQLLNMIIEYSELGLSAHEPVDPAAMIRMFLLGGFLCPKIIQNNKNIFELSKLFHLPNELHV